MDRHTHHVVLHGRVIAEVRSRFAAECVVERNPGATIIALVHEHATSETRTTHDDAHGKRVVFVCDCGAYKVAEIPTTNVAKLDAITNPPTVSAWIV